MEIEDPAFPSVTVRVNVVKSVDKVKLLHDYLITKFQARFYPGQELAVDKTMVGFRGRFGAKQYMLQKLVKSRIKCFTLAGQLHWMCTRYFYVHWCWYTLYSNSLSHI